MGWKLYVLFISIACTLKFLACLINLKSKVSQHFFPPLEHYKDQASNFGYLNNKHSVFFLAKRTMVLFKY